MWNARLDELQTGIKIAGRNINSLRYAGDTTLMAESEEELKSLLMKVKEESEKPGLENFEHYFTSMWDECNCADQTSQHIKKQRHYFPKKGLSSESCGFSSSHVWMGKLDYNESWAEKNWSFWTVVLEKTLERLGLQENPTSPF